MEIAEQDIARTARRIRWTVRVVFLAAAALTAVLLLAYRSEGDTGSWVVARTDQGYELGIRMRDGEPVFLDTDIEAACPPWEPWIVDWARGPNAPVPWRYDDGRLTIEETSRPRLNTGWTGVRHLRLDGRVEDGRLTGHMSMTAELRYAGGRVYPCRSGEVTFSPAG